MIPPLDLYCPEHDEKLRAAPAGDFLECTRGCRYPCVGNVPRFVSSTNYAAAFGSQWKAFRRTQLDSYTHTTITRDRLQRCLGGLLDVLRGKMVLEAGCGAGRFTELLLESGASVFACDLSDAVEANYENCRGFPGYFCCQADIARLPVRPGQFDYVVCLGVIQHTPDPEQTLQSLARHLKPGGVLVIDHYTGKILLRATQAALRWFLLKRSPRFTLRFCAGLVGALWPFHRLCWRAGSPTNRPWAYLRAAFLHFSPVIDYHYSYPQLGEQLLKTWAILDTHDALTDCYKHTRTLEEIAATLRSLGLIEVSASHGGNGIEARAKRPIP